MATVKVFRNAVPPAKLDAWDKIKGIKLDLTREEAKVVFTLLGHVACGFSGAAGEAASRVWHSMYDNNPELNSDNNLYIADQSSLTIKAR